ncbi:4'-phosphopantetheinyl transferase family protein [Streptomyces chartreusis]
MSELLPPDIQTAEEFTDPEGASLFPEELNRIGNVVDSRFREFTTARLCARRALSTLGYPAVPLVPGVQGAPIWPASVVGSITHCTGYRAAAVACRTDAASLGIDAEPHEPVAPGIIGRVALGSEQALLVELTNHDPTVHWGRLLFSAKESVYKAWFPLVGERLGFDDASIDIDPEARQLRARLLRESRDREGRRLHEFHGRWYVGRGLVLTAFVYRP